MINHKIKKGIKVAMTKFKTKIDGIVNNNFDEVLD